MVDMLLPNHQAIIRYTKLLTTDIVSRNAAVCTKYRSVIKMSQHSQVSV